MDTHSALSADILNLESSSILIAHLELSSAKKRGREHSKEGIVNGKMIQTCESQNCESKKNSIDEECGEYDAEIQRERVSKRKRMLESDSDEKFRKFSHRAARVSSRIRKIKYPQILFTPLMAAAMTGDFEKVKNELKNCDRNKVTMYVNFHHSLHDGAVVTNWSALRYACYYSRLDIIPLLLNAGSSLLESDLPRHTFKPEVRKLIIQEEKRRLRLAFLMGSISPQSEVFKACLSNVLYDKNAICMIFDFLPGSTANDFSSNEV